MTPEPAGDDPEQPPGPDGDPTPDLPLPHDGPPGPPGSAGSAGSPGSPGSADELPLEAIVVERPVEAIVASDGPLKVIGTVLSGFAMGTADVVPGFSGGTVALVVGIYERLVANVRQGARTLSLLLRGRPVDAWRGFLAIEWLFVGSLLIGIASAIIVLAGPLRALITERPIEMSAVFLGLVLGATIVASREFRAPSPWHVLIVAAAAAATFVGLGSTGGTVTDPTIPMFFGAGAIAICAMILPGVSGSFLLLLLGVYTPVLAAVEDRDLLVVLVFGLGAVTGLAAFSTLLNWLLSRYHDLVLAALLGLMVGSARVLWPWPSATGMGDPTLGAPQADTFFLATALALAAFALVWMFGLFVTALERRSSRRAAVHVDDPTD